MSAEHCYQRADKAARTVDPMILASALDHIARSAAKSRSQTRRIRWIEQRALIALRGQEYRDIDLDLPKSAGPDTAEKLQRRMAYHIAVKQELLEALTYAIKQVPELATVPGIAAAIANAGGAS